MDSCVSHSLCLFEQHNGGKMKWNPFHNKKIQNNINVNLESRDLLEEIDLDGDLDRNRFLVGLIARLEKKKKQKRHTHKYNQKHKRERHQKQEEKRNEHRRQRVRRQKMKEKERKGKKKKKKKKKRGRGGGDSHGIVW